MKTSIEKIDKNLQIAFTKQNDINSDIKNALSNKVDDSTFEEEVSGIKESVQGLESGIIDTIVPSSPAPTKRGQYVVSEVGVYVNFKDSNNQAISIIEEEFTSGAVYIIFNGTDSRKVVVPIKANGEVKEGDDLAVSGGKIFNLINKKNAMYLIFVQGTLSQSTGQDSPGTWPNRIKTDFVEAIEIENIECNNGYEIDIYIYDQDKMFVSKTGYKTEHSKLIVNGFFRVICKKVNNENLLPTDPNIDVRFFEIKYADKEQIKIVNDKLYTTLKNNAVFVQGTLSQSTGQDSPGTWPKRLKSDYQSTLSIFKIKCLDNQEVNIYLYDEDKNFIRSVGYAVEHLNIVVNGYFRLICKNIDDTNIVPNEANVETELMDYRFKINIEEDNKPIENNNQDFPSFSSIQFGDYINSSLSEKIEVFEQLLDLYPAVWSKSFIGKSTDNLHDIYGYSIIPESYTVTIAITAHVHGNEKYNPCGFLGVLSSISNNYLSQSFLKWIKDNVRWEIIFVCSPTAYVANTRNTGRVNLNRNMDYAWQSTPDTDKGTEPYSLQEAKCIRDYFTSKKHIIDFHLDLHDIPTTNNIAYAPFQNEKWIWMQHMNDITTCLAARNDVNSIRIPYVGKFGSVSNFFNEIIGVPSITPEHVTSWWSKFGYHLDSQIAKSTEQIVAFIYMFSKIYVNPRYTSYYTGLISRSFLTEEFGISSSWDNLRLFNETKKMTSFSHVVTSGINCFIYEPTEYNRTVLIVGGISDDDMNSALVIKNTMEMITKEKEELPMYVSHLKKSRLVFIPILNPENLSEDVLDINNVLIEYLPDYTLVVRGTKNDKSVKPLEIRSSSLHNLTDWSNKNTSIKYILSQGIENQITRRYSCLILNNFETDVYKYGYLTNKWITHVINDIASFFKNEANI
ncbi:M14 family zinc carboxypeptidase [Myroides odoratus]